jgi:hypothetical protein
MGVAGGETSRREDLAVELGDEAMSTDRPISKTRQDAYDAIVRLSRGLWHPDQTELTEVLNLLRSADPGVAVAPPPPAEKEHDDQARVDVQSASSPTGSTAPDNEPMSLEDEEWLNAPLGPAPRCNFMRWERRQSQPCADLYPADQTQWCGRCLTRALRAVSPPQEPTAE